MCMPPPGGGVGWFLPGSHSTSLRGLLPLTANLAAAHIFELDLDRVAGVERLEAFVECAGGDDVARD